MSSSSSSSFGPQARPHALSVLLSSLLQGEKEHTRRWLRDEMEQLVDPMLDTIFQRLNNKLANVDLGESRSGDRETGGDRTQMANLVGQIETAKPEVQRPAFLTCQPATSVISYLNADSHQPASIAYEPENDPEILAEVKREIEEENETALQNMADSTSQSSQHFGPQIELDCDLNRNRNDDNGDGAQLLGLHVESGHTQLATFTTIQPSTTTFNSDSHQKTSIGYEPENDPEILAEVKREIEEENEMALQNVMDNKTSNQQIEECVLNRNQNDDDDGDGAQLLGQFEHVESRHTQLATFTVQPSTTTLNSEFQQQASIAYEPENDPELLAEVKREIEEEMALQNVMDTTINSPQSIQQFGPQIEECVLNRNQTENGGNRAQVMNSFEHVELPQPATSFNSNSLLSHSSGYEPENDPEILAEVKREIEEETEIVLKEAMDNKTSNQQIKDCDLNCNQTEDNRGDCELLNPFEHVESPHNHTFTAQPLTTTFNSEIHQPASIGYEPENDPEILAEVKREIEEENEIALKEAMDSAPQSNLEDADDMSHQVDHILQDRQQTLQVNSTGSSTHDQNLSHKTDLTLVENGMQLEHQAIFDDNINNQVLDEPVNNATEDDTPQDCAKPEMKEEFDDEQMIDNDGEIDIEEDADGNDHVEEKDGDEDTEIDSDGGGGGLEDSQHEESSVENVTMHPSPPQPNGQSKLIVRRSSRLGKRTHDEQQSNQQVDTRHNLGDENEEDYEVNSRSVKRYRPASPSTSSSSSQDKLIITLSVRCPQGCVDTIAQDNFNKHMMDKHSIGPLPCPVKDCGQSFVTRHSIGIHRKQAHQHTTQWRCDKCPKHFITYRKLSDHYNVCHHLGHFQCSFRACQFTGDCKRKVYSHYKYQHKPDFVCGQAGCDYRNKDATNFKTHERTHLGIKPYHCKWPNCHYSSTSYANTTIHIMGVHLKSKSRTNLNPDMAHLGKPKDYLEVVR